MMKTIPGNIHLAADELSDRCYVLDQSWRIAVFNRAAERYFRRARETVLGRVVWDVFPAMRGTEFETHYHRAMEGRTVEHFEARSPVTSRWISVHLYPCEEGLTLFFHDIDDRKRAEEALRESEERLATSNTLLELITNGLPVLISYIDSNERYCFANLAYERGSEFTVRLPATTAGVLSLPHTDTNTAGKVPAQAPRRVLVVDDNRDAACSLAALLELSGHSLRVTFAGAEAIEEASHFRPEIVLLDLGMPGMDGFAVCRNMRAEPWGKHIRIIALTGWGDDEAKRHAAEAGFDDHLTKPVDPAHLERLIGTQERLES